MNRPPRLRVAVLARAVRPLHGTGGLERSVYDLVRHLAARDVAVTLITPPPGEIWRQSPDDPFGSPFISVRHVPYVTFPYANRRGTTILDRSTAYPLFGWRAGRAARALVREKRIDIVHAFGASGLGYAAGKRTGDAPLVFNPQGLEEFGASAEHPPRLKRLAYGPLRLAVRRCARAADAIIATDRALEPVVARHLSPRAEQVVTIPNGLDLGEVCAIAGPADGRMQRQQHRIGEGEFVVLSVGRLEHNKGFDLLARALAVVRQQRSALDARGWRWVIAGAGPYRSALESLVHELDLSAHVVFTGRVSDADLHAWYEAASVFVHPTRYEGSSLVTLEAMAHRRPVIATRAGGLPDKVVPGDTGWLIPVEDVEALAAALSDALASPGLAGMGESGRRKVEAEFAWPVLADQTIALYDRLLT